MNWHKSSYSGTQSNCVEIGTAPDIVAVRDTKARHEGMLTFTPTTWNHFLHRIKTTGVNR